jgi:cytochrome bd ubiquinol oxidase subunit I
MNDAFDARRPKEPPMLEALSRLQFALTIGFHYLFVPASIGLIFYVAIFETAHFFTKKLEYKSLSNFWSDIFLVVYVVGIATGLTMPIQFGTNWSKYSVFMGDVFGSPLAFEALMAFFLESTFAGIWIFKRNKIGRGLRLATVWLITLGTVISAVWILTANAFMQHPVGYELAADKSKVMLTSFGQLLSNPYLIWMFFHNHAAALLVGSFIVLGVSAHSMKKRGATSGFKRSTSLALVIGLVSAVALPGIGDLYGKYVATIQPLKASIILGQLKSNGKGGLAPDATSAASLPVDIASLPEFPDATLVHTAYLGMVVLGSLFALSLLVFTLRRRLLWENRFFQTYATALIPIGYLAVMCGWIVTEAGRVPWIVYGLMPIRDAISNVPVASVVFSLCLMVLLYALLAAVALKLIANVVRKGPENFEEALHASA